MQIVGLEGHKKSFRRRNNCINKSTFKGTSHGSWTKLLESLGYNKNNRKKTPLYRMTSNFYVLDDEIGSTIAWPKNYVALN